jgi:type I restriction enzyme M protein
VRVINPRKHERILDPACGTAGFLISAWKHILEQNQKARPGDLLTPDERNKLAVNIHGYDISPDMVRLSLVNLYLHGFTDPHVDEYDTLTSEDKWNEHFDVILANPPFMSPKGGIKPHKRFSLARKYCSSITSTNTSAQTVARESSCPKASFFRVVLLTRHFVKHWSRRRWWP